MEFVWPAISAVFSAAVAGWFSYLKFGRKADISQTKQEKEDERKETEQVFDMQQTLIRELKGDIKKILNQLHQLEKDHLLSREENAVWRTENKFLKERIATMKEDECGRVRENQD